MGVVLSLSRQMMHLIKKAILQTAVFAAVGLAISGAVIADETGLQMVFELPIEPAGLTISPKGDFLFSLRQEEKPLNRVVEVSKTGDSKPFPTIAIAQAAKDEPLILDAVRGMQADGNGVVWMLDNGRRSELPPRVIAWDYGHKKLHRVINLVAPAVLTSSVPDDLALDPGAPFLYLTDPSNGGECSLIVVDLTTGFARRVLQGHPSVMPVEGLDLVIDGVKIETRRLDGSLADPMGGVSPLVLDRKGEWLYFGPLRSNRLYRVKTEHLRNASLSADKLAGLVEQYADKPLCAGITMDFKGNIYVSDLSQKAIGVIQAGTKKYQILVSDPRFLWPGGLCFGNDGRLYFYTNASRTRATTGTNRLQSPVANYLFRVQTPASGRVGD